MQEIRPDHARGHATMSMSGISPILRAHSGLFHWKKDPCEQMKNAVNVNLKIRFLSRLLNLCLSVSESMSTVMMIVSFTIRRLQSVGQAHTQLPLPHPAIYPIHRVTCQQCNHLQKCSLLLSQSTEQPTQLFTLCEGRLGQWHLRMAVNLVISLLKVPSKTGKHTPNIFRAKTWQLDRVV